jgi:hypothetical protein
MKTEERAWISITVSNVTFPKDESTLDQVPVSSMVNFDNVGKTVAKQVQIDAVMDYVVNGDSPDFVYASRPRNTGNSGAIFPNTPSKVPVEFLNAPRTPNSGKPQPRFLSAYEYQSLLAGKGYMVIYAQATYIDIFGTEHWTHYCQFFVHPNSPQVDVTARKCADYNDTDHAEAGLLRWLYKD